MKPAPISKKAGLAATKITAGLFLAAIVALTMTGCGQKEERSYASAVDVRMVDAVQDCKMLLRGDEQDFQVYLQKCEGVY